MIVGRSPQWPKGGEFKLIAIGLNRAYLEDDLKRYVVDLVDGDKYPQLDLPRALAGTSGALPLKPPASWKPGHK